MMKLATLNVSFVLSSLLHLNPCHGCLGKKEKEKDSCRTITNPLSVWTRKTTGSEAAGPFPAQRDGLWREANLGIALFKSRRRSSSGHVEDDCNNDAGRLYATLICFSAKARRRRRDAKAEQGYLDGARREKATNLGPDVLLVSPNINNAQISPLTVRVVVPLSVTLARVCFLQGPGLLSSTHGWSLSARHSSSASPIEQSE